LLEPYYAEANNKLAGLLFYDEVQGNTDTGIDDEALANRLQRCPKI